MKSKYIPIFASALAVALSCSNNDKPLAYGIIDCNSWMVASAEGGQIVSLNIEEGQEVTKDILAVQVDTVQLSLQLASIEAQASSLRGTLPDVGKQLDVLKSKKSALENEAARVRPLVVSGSISAAQIDKLEDEISMVDSQIAATQSSLSRESSGILSNISALEAQAEILKDKIARCTVFNPEDGTVVRIFTKEHEFTAAGGPIYKLADYDNMFIDCWFDGKALNTIKLADKVSVRVEAPEGLRTYVGTISYIANEAEFTPSKVPTRDSRAKLVYHVKVSVQNDGFLKAGLSADIYPCM